MTTGTTVRTGWTAGRGDAGNAATRSSSCSSCRRSIMILASAVMPLARVTATRTARGRAAAGAARDADGDRQVQGRRRPAADRPLDIKAGSEGYPADLETLVDGVTAANDATGRKLKFLRRVPIDPMTAQHRVGTAVVSGRPKSTRWGGQNVFDVYTTFEGTALDGTEVQGLVGLVSD